MKKAVLVSLIVAVSLLFAGIIFAIAGLVLGNLSPVPGQSGAISYEKKTYVTDAAGITSLLAESSNHSIKVQPVYGSEIKMTYYVNQYESYDIQNENGQLTLQHVVKKQWPVFRGFNLDFRDSGVVIELPESFSGALHLKTSNAKISLNDLDLAGRIEAITSNSSIFAENVKAQDEIYFKTSNSRIQIDSIESDRIYCKSSNAEIDAKEVRATRLELVSSNGAIELDAVMADEIDLDTSNAGISGTIVGRSNEYRIQSDTSNAKDSLENLGGNGPNKLTVKTSNGPIGLRFVEP